MSVEHIIIAMLVLVILIQAWQSGSIPDPKEKRRRKAIEEALRTGNFTMHRDSTDDMPK